MLRRPVTCALAALLALAACGDAQAPGLDASAASPPTPRAEAVEPLAPVEPPAPVALPAPTLPSEPPNVTLTAGATIAVPAGILHVGSRPGSEGRDARAEADLVPVELPAFRIDALPYPNDPDAPPRTGVSLGEAAELCEAEGKRLCDELEWERACAGDESATYGSGASLDPEACAADPERCLSPFGVASLGTHLGEWTSSPAARGLGSPLATAVFRGAAASGEAPLHRCAARRAAVPDTRSRHLGFRCCEGPRAVLAYPDEPPLARFRPRDATDALREALSTLPELAPFAEGLRIVDAEAAASAVSDPALLHGWELVPTGVLRWASVPGEEIWVVSARGTRGAFVAALHRLRDGSFAHGASFVLEGERTPIAVAFTPPSPSELQWSAAWGRAGEGGTLRYERGRVFITQR
ncbi:MAG: SUMF1/EgtB/PvdO family nonheme iron enzyme [Myxococcota bacterium]